jgi:SAM-dependent methyltransferase
MAQLSPKPIVDNFEKYLNLKNIKIHGRTILEIGTGISNSTGYEIMARGAAKYFAYEPYVKCDSQIDDRLFQQIKKDYPNLQKNGVSRIVNLGDIKNNSIDILLSQSVLEHVNNFEQLMTELKPLLTQSGCMLHVVDYRDHFFKYPYHFLQFSKNIWDLFLNPGDLERWRINQHIHQFEKTGFIVDVLHTETDAENFEKIKPYLHNDYKNNDKMNSVIHGVLFVNAL